MKKHYTYILYSMDYDKYYIGQTPDLETRLLFHNEISATSFTSKYRPWKLMTFIVSNSRANAMKIEKYLKKKHRTFIKRVILESSLREYILNKFLR